MSCKIATTIGWAVKWRSGPNNIDQRVWEHFCPRTAGELGSCVFKSRKAAKAWAKEQFGYITARRDLRRYPHDWRLPIVVRVSLTIQEIENERD